MVYAENVGSQFLSVRHAYQYLISPLFKPWHWREFWRHFRGLALGAAGVIIGRETVVRSHVRCRRVYLDFSFLVALRLILVCALRGRRQPETQ